MRFNLRLSLAILAIVCSTLAQAGTTVLGFEIGVTTLDQLKRDLAKKTKLQSQGTNKYTGGEMIKTAGNGYDIEGLNGVLYIFDDQKKLSAVIMDMGKYRFDSIFQFLSSKYKVVEQRRQFVGDQYARFKPNDATIEIEAPHLSFVMEVRYIRNDLMQKFIAINEAEAAAKKKSEAAKF
jgi:hypothetical protein